MEPQNSPKIPANYLDEVSRETVKGSGELYQWKGFWLLPHFLAGIIAAESHFKAENDDVILASPVKAGSTWLKAIIPCIINHNVALDYDPFIQNHPNSLMPHLELQIYGQDPIPDISGMPSPRLFRTNMPHSLLPDSLRHSDSKVVYIARNPKDAFVSRWYFLNTRFEFPFEESFDNFCKGTHAFGPYIDHVLEYWKESQKRPEKILFLKYEDMKIDPVGQVQKLSDFLGKKLGEEEVKKILEKCSLERMKSLEINNNGVDPHVGFSYGSYFRKGSVGDWKNHLTPEMAHRLDHITKMKLEGSGLEL